jgi:hypothetical protein
LKFVISKLAEAVVISKGSRPAKQQGDFIKVIKVHHPILRSARVCRNSASSINKFLCNCSLATYLYLLYGIPIAPNYQKLLSKALSAKMDSELGASGVQPFLGL